MQEEIELDVKGMTCESCAAHVIQALRGTTGVTEANVPGWQSGRAFLTVDPLVEDEVLVEAVQKAGYQAAVRTRRETSAAQSAIDHSRKRDYDLIVVGSGAGGMAAAIKAAELGYRAAIVEGGTIGGTCVNVGCVPSKTLIRAATAYHGAGHHAFRGVQTHAVGLDWKALIQHKDDLVAELQRSKYGDVLASYGDNITLIPNWARLESDGRVALDDGRVITANKIVIATGARPAILPLAGIDEVEVLTSTSVMALEKQPESLVFIGGRAVALELGQMFARLGTRVTLLQRSGRLIPEHEPEISEALADVLRQEGLTVHIGVTPLAIAEEDGQKVITVEVNGERREFRAEQIVMATGRKPNSHDIGLEDAGVKLDAGGFIIVNDRMETTNPNIYAVGDVTNRPKLVYVAAAGGGIAAENALLGSHRQLDLTVLPDVIFTDPQVASVGLTEIQATARGLAVKVSILPLSYVPRALAARDTRGLIKLVADRDSDRLLGAHILASEAGEVIQTAALSVKFGVQAGFTVKDLRETLFPYLVQAEGLKLAAMSFEKDVTQLSCCAG